MKKIIITCLINIPWVFLAQESVNSSGGMATGGGYHFSYSIGQVVYSSFGDNAFSITQGVQQQYIVEDSINGNTENLTDFNLSIFPNPFIESFTIAFKENNPEASEYFLTDLNGRLIQKGVISMKETIIVTKNLSTANYFLTLRNDNETFKTFKLSKF